MGSATRPAADDEAVDPELVRDPFDVGDDVDDAPSAAT